MAKFLVLFMDFHLMDGLIQSFLKNGLVIIFYVSSSLNNGWSFITLSSICNP